MFIGRTDAKAKTPNFGHLMRRVDSLEETLMLGGIGGRRRRGRQRMRWLDGITNSNGHEFEHAPGDGEGLAESDRTEQLNNNKINGTLEK